MACEFLSVDDASTTASMQFHRNPIFLCGLLPLIIVLTMWVDSKHSVTAIFRNGSHGRSICVLSDGGLIWGDHVGAIALHQQVPFAPFLARGRRSPNEVSNANPKSGEVYVSASLGSLISDYRSFPLWFVLVFYLPLWLGVALWHATRRHARLLAGSAGREIIK